MKFRKTLFSRIALAAAASCLLAVSAHAQNGYQQKNLVSDIPGFADRTDPNLVNPWGMAASATSPFWVSNAGSGTSTLYNGAGVPQALVVRVPLPTGGLSSPTGQVFNAGAAFNSDRFIFATEEGTIHGWRGALGATAELLFDRSSAGSVYKGLAIGSVDSTTHIYAADFRNNRIDVFNSSGPLTLAGSFSDPGLPAGYAPFNVQNLGGQLYVTYALQDAAGMDDVAGAGNGFVSVFDLNGNFQRRLASNGALNSPWGLAIAPEGFGEFGGDLLVGNFGDGTINAYDLATGTFLDALRGAGGVPLVIEGLWGLMFGNGANAGPRSTLYFTAGISGGEEIEAHGLFGSITPVPEPGTLFAGAALAGLCLGMWWKRRKAATAAAV